jgi:hypothetical protein
MATKKKPRGKVIPGKPVRIYPGDKGYPKPKPRPAPKRKPTTKKKKK